MPTGKTAGRKPKTTTTRSSNSRSAAPARSAAKPKATRTRAASGKGDGRIFGSARTLALNLPEFPLLGHHFALPPPSMLSPFIDLMVPGAKGIPRPIDEITAGISSLPDPAARFVLSPLSVPDRIIDTRATLFNGAPTLCRLFSSRKYEGIFAGLRAGLDFDYEIVSPFSVEDMELWVRLQLQLSNAAELPMIQSEFAADELAFLLCLVDAFKLSFARSFTQRRPGSTPTRISMADILEAQSLALSQPDRRWIAHAIGELLSAVVHPGGATNVRLPIVDEAVAKKEIRRYVSEGFMQSAQTGANPTLELGPTLSVFAGSLFTWSSLVSIHDMQVVGMDGSKPFAQEELLMFIATDPTIWGIGTQGLSRSGEDLSPVRFHLRSLDLITAVEIARDMFLPVAGLELPDEIYAPSRVAAPAAGQQMEESVSRAPGFVASHMSPEEGLDAWEKPDPNAEPVAEVEGGIEMQVLERKGAWARVTFENGWSAWVDGRELEEVGK